VAVASAAVVNWKTMSNKPHRHPHKQRGASRATRLLVAILLIALFLLGLALSAAGHPLFLR
jgi:cytochrome b561